MIRKWLTRFSIILTISLCMICQRGAVHAASPPGFTITGYMVDAALQDDGSAQIVETVSCRINRDLRQITFQIPDQGSIDFQEISVDSQTKVAEQDMFVVVEKSDEDGSEAKPNTYALSSSTGAEEIRLSATFSAGTDRKIRLTYRVSKIVVLNQDAAQIKWRFFTACPGADVGSPVLTIVLPGKLMTSMQIWSLPVSLTEFISIQASRDKLTFRATSLPAAHTMVLVSLLPPDLFSKAQTAENPKSWEALAASARQMQVDLGRQADRQNNAYSLIFILIGIAFALIALIYLLFDRDGAAVFKQAVWQEMPPGVRPAVLASLLRQKKVSRLILGTLADLVRRGELALHGLVFERLEPLSQDGSPASSLADFEKNMLDWLFSYVASGTTLSTAEIRKYARDQETAARFRLFCQQFLGDIDAEMTKLHLLDELSGRRGKIIGLASSAAYLVLAVTGTILLKTTDALLLILPCAALAAYSLQIRRFTQSGREVHAEGLALVRTLQRIDKNGKILRDGFDHDFLPLAICLGFFERLADTAANRGRSLDYRVYGYHHAVSDPKFMQSLASDFEAMESMLSSSLLLSYGFHW
jgi:hypothetical protein